MKNPLIDKKHISEYLFYGFIAAVVYTTFVLLFLKDNRYENFYLLYIGNFAFMAVMGFYTYQLSNRTFEGKRSVSMLIAGSFAMLSGIIISLLMLMVGIILFYPEVFSALPTDAIVQDAPDTIQVHRPTGLAFMISMNTVLVNFGGGSLVNVLFSYAGKKDQIKDKPTPTQNHIHPVTEST